MACASRIQIVFQFIEAEFVGMTDFHWRETCSTLAWNMSDNSISKGVLLALDISAGILIVVILVTLDETATDRR